MRNFATVIFQYNPFMTLPSVTNSELSLLARQLEGELHYDNTMRTLYATDASAYREMPLAVAMPKSIKDIKTLISYAAANHISRFRVLPELLWPDRL